MSYELKFCKDALIEVEKSSISFESEMRSYYRSPTERFKKFDVEWNFSLSSDSYHLNSDVAFNVKVKNPNLTALKAQGTVDLHVQCQKNETIRLFSEVEEIDDLDNTLLTDNYNNKLISESDKETLKMEGILSLKLQRKVKLESLMDANLLKHWKSFENVSTEDSDFTFNVMGIEIKVNKSNLSSVSEVMKNIFEENSTYAEEMFIKPVIFKILLHFANGDQKSFEQLFDDCSVFDVFEAAHKYQMKVLEDYCIAVIFNNFTDLRQIYDTYHFAWQFGILELRDFCWDVIKFDIIKCYVSMMPQSPLKITKYFDMFNGSFESKKTLKKVQSEFIADMTDDGDLKDVAVSLVTAISKTPKRKLVKEEIVESSPEAAGPSNSCQSPKKKKKKKVKMMVAC